MFAGPDLNNKLLGVLLRFRKFGIAAMGDVREIFHQVRVLTIDKDVLRFLWWQNGDIDKNVVTYCMTVHLFGGVWSPSCAAYALKHAADDNEADYSPDVTNAVEEFFLMIVSYLLRTNHRLFK